jgi:RNA polymerase sigma-70 factor (ECF subfamily)
MTAPETSVLAQLARDASTGDTAATTELLRRLAPEMTRVVRGVLGARTADVDDATQQALVALIRALPAFRGECSPAGYACRIAFRTARAVRAAVRKQDLRQSLSADLDTLEAGPEALSMREAEQRKAALRALLDSLPSEQAEAMCMRTVLGWSLDEIAQASGAPLNTVRSRLRLAKEALRAKLEQDPSLLEALGAQP